VTFCARKRSRYFISLTSNLINEPTDPLRLLKLMQLADSALPIGSAAHSFGLESLIAEELLSVDTLSGFLGDYLEETGVLEAAFCRAAHKLGGAGWTALNQRLSARKPAHESRAASLTLGRRFLQLFLALEGGEDPGGDAHYCTAFGYVGRALGVEEAIAASVYLQQAVNGLVSACQRLMPLGQQRAARLLWELKPAVLQAAHASGVADPDAVGSFTPLVEVASMRHVGLGTRLFIS
jgi:urease accessory protein